MRDFIIHVLIFTGCAVWTAVAIVSLMFIGIWACEALPAALDRACWRHQQRLNAKDRP